MKILARSAAVTLSATALLLSATTANAATWVTTLDASEAQSNGPWGTVTVNELDAYTVEVSLLLADGYKIVDTGAHHAFTFNLVDSPNSSIVITEGGGGTNPLTYLGEGSFNNAPYSSGPNGPFTNAFSCCGPGANNAKVTPFTFTVYNASGITFAGDGYTVDGDGKLTGLGTGNRFGSNNGGWWFAVDVVSPTGGTTGVVAGRDAFLQPGVVPEPATWAMLIMGFGAVGAVIRRRRATTAFA